MAKRRALRAIYTNCALAECTYRKGGPHYTGSVCSSKSGASFCEPCIPAEGAALNRPGQALDECLNIFAALNSSNATQPFAMSRLNLEVFSAVLAQVVKPWYVHVYFLCSLGGRFWSGEVVSEKGLQQPSSAQFGHSAGHGSQHLFTVSR